MSWHTEWTPEKQAEVLYAVGNRVKYMRTGNTFAVGATGTIVRVRDRKIAERQTIEVEFDDPVLTHRFGKAAPFRSWRFDRIDLPIDPKLPVTTRDGRTVKVVAFADDYITAEVFSPGWPGGSRRFTYQRTGHFYRTIQQPIDLVNAP